MTPPIQSATLPREVAPFTPPTVGSMLPFCTLPEPLQPHQMPDLLRHLAEAIEQVDVHTSAAELRRVVQWALRQSYSAHLAPVERMTLLNEAWRVQKLLWSTSEPLSLEVPQSQGDRSV